MDNQISQKLLNKLAVETYNNAVLETKLEELQTKVTSLRTKLKKRQVNNYEH